MRIRRLHAEDLAQYFLRLVELAEEHVAVCLIDEIRDVRRPFFDCLGDPFRRFLIVAEADCAPNRSHRAPRDCRRCA